MRRGSGWVASTRRRGPRTRAAMRRRRYLEPDQAQLAALAAAAPAWRPQEPLRGKCAVSLPLYGMSRFADLFTARQLLALETLAGLVGEARARAEADARRAGLADD